jgi:hypothetical protein
LAAADISLMAFGWMQGCCPGTAAMQQYDDSAVSVEAGGGPGADGLLQAAAAQDVIVAQAAAPIMELAATAAFHSHDAISLQLPAATCGIIRAATAGDAAASIDYLHQRAYVAPAVAPAIIATTCGAAGTHHSTHAVAQQQQQQQQGSQLEGDRAFAGCRQHPHTNAELLEAGDELLGVRDRCWWIT